MLTFLTILFVVAVLIFINAFYVAGEFSTVSARRTRITQMAEQGNRLARILLPVLKDRHKLDNYIAASQVGITLSSIVLGIYGEQQIAPHIAPWIARLPLGIQPAVAEQMAAAGIATTLVLFVLTTLQVIFGELLPKSLAIQSPEGMALFTTLPLKWSAEVILRPLIIVLNGSGTLILRLLGVTPSPGHSHVHSAQEIVILVKESHRGGLIDATERLFLQNVFRSSETPAVEIAVPRTRIVAAPVDRPVDEVLKLAADSAYTRIPVYEGDMDHIVGFVHLRDLFTLYCSDKNGNLRQIVRSIPFVPETLSAAEVWNRLNETQSYLAIVFDEYGGTSGLITREDLIEELFGELQDEFDQERAFFKQAGEGRFVVRGDVPISYLNDRLEIDLPHTEVHTVGGLVMDLLGRIPEVGDEVEIQGVRLQVEAVADRSVLEVSVALPSGAREASAEGTS
jgi:putative hemolysin